MFMESKKENESNKIVKHIMEWGDPKKRAKLDLCQCSNSWALVLKSGNWQKLLTLNLSWCQINESNIAELANISLPQLKQFWLCHNKLNKPCLKILININFHNLTLLNLSWNKIGSEGAKCIAKLELPQLSNLQSKSCLIGNEGLKHLCKSNWPKLQKLLMDENKITTIGFEAISSLSNWKQFDFKIEIVSVKLAYNYLNNQFLRLKKQQ